MLKKTVLVLLILSMSLSFLLSCKEKPGSTQTTAADSLKAEEKSYYEKLGPKSFYNEEFVILDANDYPDMHVNIPSDEGYTTDTLNNAIYDRDIKIESLYNVKIKYVQITKAPAGIETFTKSYAAGDLDFDAIISTASGGRIDMLATSGYLADLCTLPTLDLKANWWSPLMYENLRLSEKMYYTTGDIAASVYDAPMVMFVNNKLMSDYNITDDLFQAVNDGKWTLDYMESLTKGISADLDGGGMHADTDFFSTICQSNRLSSNAWLIGAGYSMSDIENGGNSIVVQNTNDKLLSIVEKLSKIIVPATYITPNDVIDKTFKDNRALFLCHLMESAKARLDNMESKFSILPMPKFDEDQKDYRSLVNGWVDCYVGVPSYVLDSDEQAKKVGFLLEAMAYASYEGVRPIAYEAIYKSKSVRNEETSKMLDIIYNSLYLDFNALYDFGGSCTVIANHIFKGTELVSELTAKESAIDVAVQKVVDAWNSIED